MNSNQDYCLTKILGHAQIFGDYKRQRNKFDLIEEDKFIGHVFKQIEINLPSTPRTSYLCTFSNDGRFVASNHSDNKIYVCDLQTGKIVNVLDGHARYSWSLAFHPVHNHILASGCVGGQVKIYDLKNNASQEWQNLSDTSHPTVVSSLSFHPTQDLLCIAINNHLYFYNWRTSEDVISISTSHSSQKIRLVKFDCKGRLLIGISNDPYSNDNFLRINPLFNLVFSRDTGLLNSTATSTSSTNSNNNSSFEQRTTSLNALRGLFIINDTNNNANSMPSNSINLNTISANSTAANSSFNLNNSNNRNNSTGQSSFDSGLNNNHNNNHTSNNSSNSIHTNSVLERQIRRNTIRIQSTVSINDYLQQNRMDFLRQEEELFNLSNAITDSIESDNLLPDDLPSFSFLQRNYQATNGAANLYNQVIEHVRRLETGRSLDSNELDLRNDELSNERDNQTGNERTDQRTDQRINQRIDERSEQRTTNRQTRRIGHRIRTNLNNSNDESGDDNYEDEDINVVMESTNLIERFINRHRTMQDSLDSTLNILTPRNRDYFLRRRLSRMAYRSLIDRHVQFNLNGSTLSNLTRIRGQSVFNFGNLLNNNNSSSSSTLNNSTNSSLSSNRFFGLHTAPNASSSTSSTSSNLSSASSSSSSNASSSFNILNPNRRQFRSSTDDHQSTSQRNLFVNNEETSRDSTSSNTSQNSNNNESVNYLNSRTFIETMREARLLMLFQNRTALANRINSSGSSASSTVTNNNNNNLSINNNNNNNNSSINQSQQSNSSLSSSTNVPPQDNHNRFYALLQHQAFRQMRQDLNTSSNYLSEYINYNSNTNHLSTLINQIQNSINAINRANPSLANEETIQQLNTNGHAVLRRLIYFINHREKLINFKNIIVFLLIECSDPNQRSDLNQCLQLINLLIKHVEQMTRTLVTDLRFIELSRLYLMRRQTTTANLNRASEQIENNERILNNEANNANDQNDNEESNQQIQSNFFVEQATSSTSNLDAIPSTSKGLTMTKRKNTDDETISKNPKKFKIPVVKISDNDDNNIELNTNELSNCSTNSSSNGQSENSTDHNNLSSSNGSINNGSINDSSDSNNTANNQNSRGLRNEMNSLISNLETLFERLNNGSNRINQSQSQSYTPNFTSSLNYFGGQLGSPIQRVSNPILNSNRIFNLANLSNNGNNNNNSQPNNNPSPTFYISAPHQPWINFNDINENLNYRIQCIDFEKIEDLSSIISNKREQSNLVVSKCKIYNDSSVDLSSNGELLACLVPINGTTNEVNLCVYSIKKSTLGQCLFIYCSFSSNAISVSFSPSRKYIVVGLASSRLYNATNEEQIEIAQIFVLSENLANMMREFEKNKVEDDDNDFIINLNRERKLADEQQKRTESKNKTATSADLSKAVELIPIKSVYALRTDDFFTLNCMKWLPTKDCGLIYSTNNGLIICRASDKLEDWYFKHMSNLNMSNMSNRTINKSNLSRILFSSISPRSSAAATANEDQNRSNRSPFLFSF